jgi:hypothetical protein
VTAGDPCAPSNSKNSSPLTEGRKQVISTTTRTLQGITYPTLPSLRNTARTPGEKKTQNTNYRGSRDKNHNSKQLQMHESQCRMKQQHCSPSKANSPTKDPNTCFEEELLNNEFQKTMAKMVNNLKQEIQNLVFDLQRL